MSNKFFKWTSIVFALIISVMTILYCALMNYRRSTFTTLVAEVTESNENLYFKLKSITGILEVSIYIIFIIFFITVCVLYVIKDRKYSIAAISIFSMPFITFIVTLPFAIKIGHINYLLIPFHNLISGITILLISLLFRYFHNKRQAKLS